METKQTAVDLYDKTVSDIFQEYLRDEITKTELITKIHNAFYPAKQLEKQQIVDAHSTVLSKNCPWMDDWQVLKHGEQYYSETYEST